MSETKTQTSILAERGRVRIQHDQPVGTQWLTPAQARQMAGALVEYALVAEQQTSQGAN